MTVGNREEYIKYRFHKAAESLDDALILADNQRWNAVINRLYYSCYYAVISLLLKHDIETKSHDGARIQFGLHFIKTGKIDKKYGKLFTKLFDSRQKGDYGDLYDFDAEIVKPLLEQAKKFIEELEKHI